MLQMLQVMGYMMKNLGLSEAEVVETFEALCDGRLNQTGLYMELGLETCSDANFERFEDCLPKWQSALAVTKMRLNLK